jgi:hypothetical protein
MLSTSLGHVSRFLSLHFSDGSFQEQPSDLAKFPSEEWTKEYMEKLNSNANYADAGKNWSLRTTLNTASPQGCGRETLRGRRRSPEA